MERESKKVLIVEDQFLNSEFLRIWVEAIGYEVCGIARTADEACRLADECIPDVILMDLKLEGDRDGVDAAIEIGRTQQPTIIYVTASTEPPAVARINTDRPFRILNKPVEPGELVDALQAA